LALGRISGAGELLRRLNVEEDKNKTRKENTRGRIQYVCCRGFLKSERRWRRWKGYGDWDMDINICSTAARATA
jgi:hypothetical protein